MMDAVASVVERIRGLAKSTEDFIRGALRRRCDRAPIEILKRLQREAFSDLMKLRDRQDKLERMLSLSKLVKGSPFQEASTHMKGIVDVGGAVLLAENNVQQACSTLDRGGTRSGVDLKFIFETVVRQTDALVAEFMAGQNNLANRGHISGGPLVLTKLKYLAQINDWLSMILIPLGAQCHDFGIWSINSQGRGIAENLSLGPPLFSQYHGCAAGVMVKGSNLVASLSELVSGWGMQPVVTADSYLNTFGQVTYQPAEGIKLTLSGLWRMPRAPSPLIKVGLVAIPIGSLKGHTNSEPQLQTPSSAQTSSSAMTRNAIDGISTGSFVVMLDSEFDESTKFGGWMEVQKSSPRFLQWGLSLSDMPEDELGWGFIVGGKIDGHVKLESFLNFSLGKRATLQPGLVYVSDGLKKTPALVLRSSWFM